MYDDGYKRRLAVESLMGASMRSIARRYGHSENTIAGWFQEPAIVEYMTTLRSKQLDAVEKAFADLPSVAVMSLAQVASNPDERGADRVKAVEAILDLIGLRVDRSPGIEISDSSVTITPALRDALECDE